MVDMPWAVFSFWSTSGPGWGNKGSQKLCWWKEKVGGGGTRVDQRGEGNAKSGETRKEKKGPSRPGTGPPRSLLSR